MGGRAGRRRGERELEFLGGREAPGAMSGGERGERAPPPRSPARSKLAGMVLGGAVDDHEDDTAVAIAAAVHIAEERSRAATSARKREMPPLGGRRAGGARGGGGGGSGGGSPSGGGGGNTQPSTRRGTPTQAMDVPLSALRQARSALSASLDDQMSGLGMTNSAPTSRATSPPSSVHGEGAHMFKGSESARQRWVYAVQSVQRHLQRYGTQEDVLMFKGSESARQRWVYAVESVKRHLQRHRTHDLSRSPPGEGASPLATGHAVEMRQDLGAGEHPRLGRRGGAPAGTRSDAHERAHTQAQTNAPASGRAGKVPANGGATPRADLPRVKLPLRGPLAGGALVRTHGLSQSFTTARATGGDILTATERHAGRVQQGARAVRGSAQMVRSTSMEHTNTAFDNDCDSMGDCDDAQVVLGVCALSKKARSKQMTKILERLTNFGEFTVNIFGDETILEEPVEAWPICDCLISFFSEGFPLEKAEAYARLRRPFLVNDLAMQHDVLDRRRVYGVLKGAGIPAPPHIVASRDSPDWDESDFEETEDSVRIGDGKRIMKPFVEKPVSGEDHNVYIYFPPSAGGGCKKLFRKKNDRSSEYFPDINSVRRDGQSYIYEAFLPTGGTDVKVYTLGPNYAHAEARKSPVVDGRVLRTADGKEVRFPVLLNPFEKEIARAVTLAFAQMVCGFDLLRSNGRSYVCDVNGWSFVKSSDKYYDDAAGILRAMMLAAVAPQKLTRRPYPIMPRNGSDNSIAGGGDGSASDDGTSATDGGDAPGGAVDELPGKGSKHQELRCVLAVIRHGDRTPKQKMKMTTRHPKLLKLLKRHGGKRGEAKLKAPHQLEELLEVVHELIAEKRARQSNRRRGDPESDSDTGEDTDMPMRKLQHLCFVLEQGGHFSGINRKVQLKPLSWSTEPESDSSSAGDNVTADGSSSAAPSTPRSGDTPRAGANGGGDAPRGRCTEALLVLKHGGVLTPKGRAQAEFAGRAFRSAMYPTEGPDGGGLLRLHSTYRHDLKIYSSDEGRVQMSAAAFVQGLLDLEGRSLTPILVSLVKKDASMLDAFGKSTCEKIAAAKALLYDHLTQSNAPDATGETWSHCDWRMENEANNEGRRVPRRSSFSHVGPVDRLPPNSVELLHRLASELNALVSCLEVLEASVENPHGTVAFGGAASVPERASMPAPQATTAGMDAASSDNIAIEASDTSPGLLGDMSSDAHASGSPTGRSPMPLQRSGDSGPFSDYDRSRRGESLLLVHTRWSKLYNDFYSERKGTFNLSKVPDVYDMSRYDLMHTSDLFDDTFVAILRRVLATVKVLADCVIPHEYGVTPPQKLSIASDISKLLMGKLVADMLNTRGESLAMTMPRAQANERGSATEFGDFAPTADATYGEDSGDMGTHSNPDGAEGARSDSSLRKIRTSSSLGTSPGTAMGVSTSAQVSSQRSRGRTSSATRLAEADEEDEELDIDDGQDDVVESGEIGEDDATVDHRLNLKYAVNISTPARHVRSRIYFTSESHVHALVNVLRFAETEEGVPLLTQEARQILADTDQLDYLTHIVFRLFEDMDAPINEPGRFRLQIMFSSGAEGPRESAGEDDEMPDPVRPLVELPLESTEEGDFVKHLATLEDFIKLVEPHQTPWKNKRTKAQWARGKRSPSFYNLFGAGSGRYPTSRAFMLDASFSRAAGGRS